MRLLTALPLTQPGYFDAYFYYNVAEGLAEGRGFAAPFIWNYLDSPTSIPHPTNTYWMPLTSILASITFFVGEASYRAAQLPFILLSAFLPLIAYHLGQRLFSDSHRPGLAAFLTVFSGFYMTYWVSPDNFAPFAVSASLSLLFLGKALTAPRPLYFGLAGFFSGCSHLARPDGILLALVVAITLFWLWRKGRTLASTLGWGGVALLGYLLVMGPWFLYNWSTLGTPFPSAGIKTIFLQRYEDLFSYSQELSLDSYLAWGWESIFSSKLSAAVHNALVILGGLQFFLAPFAFLGIWRGRRNAATWPFILYLLLLYITMTLVFTFPSMRGSMLHSAVALLPFLFAAVPSGLKTAVEWVAQRRRAWHIPTALNFFTIGFSGLAVVISLFLYAQGFFLLPADPLAPLWNERDIVYRQVENWLKERGDVESAVMVVDPPGFWYFTHRPAMAIPSDGLAALQEAAQKFGARYLILEVDHPSAFEDLYHRRREESGLNLLHTLQDPLGHPLYIYELVVYR